MRILFIHQNAPGQFPHLAAHLARAGHEVVFLGQSGWPGAPGVRVVRYGSSHEKAETHHYLRRFETCVRRGQAAARAVLQLAKSGFQPDLVIGHPGWGEMLFLREVHPRTKLLTYCEMFYRAEGQDTGYIPEIAVDLDGKCRLRAWNADLLVNLEAMDRGLSPTRWQRDQHPAVFHPLIDVVHDGVDTIEVAPDLDALFLCPDGAVFRRGDEVVTYVARDLEPVRGFPLLIRALPELLRLRPAAHIVICGGDGVSYGRPPPGGGSWRAALLGEISVDPSRVHFVGKLRRKDYLDLLRVSALHLYLTAPFVLSWSCIEALASCCLVLASDVAPVREVIEDGVNGSLLDPRDSVSLARRAAELLASRHRLTAWTQAARERVRAEYDVRRCVDRQARIVAEMMS